ncbi:unnamed protein product [Linum tenue]|uniref:HAT C-terminal dimerisation domain-containing protein n=1 Tax=Linum tenue TaxID=586396 RepID=A0AAV0HWM3_9ROSI|nr:unnamed protein product [Linum tenue]
MLLDYQIRYGMVSFNTVERECVAAYQREKQNVMKFIEGLPGRVSLTLDTRTSREGLGCYVVITGHFIDGDWKPQQRKLNVAMVPNPDSESALANAVLRCLSDWNLEGKLLSVTLNHPAAGEAALQSLQALLSVQNAVIFDGQLVRGSCISRTLTSIAKELLSACGDLVSKIRDSVKYVLTEESKELMFLDIKQQLQMATDKNLRLADQNHWNTTYEMLLAASELREVFSCLEALDPDYKEAPSMLEWKQVETISSVLQLLVDAANLLSSTTPAALACFHEAWKIQSQLSRLAAIGDPFIDSFIGGLQDRIEKYIKECILVLAAAVVMDPRFKMKLVEFSFAKMFLHDAPTYIEIVGDGIRQLFWEYKVLHQLDEEKADPKLGINVDIMEPRRYPIKSELDVYLDETLLPRVADFDVLGWWKQNEVRFPALAKMARDVLCIQVSAGSAESLFDTRCLPKEMEYGSSVKPETVEALVCAKDWLRRAAAAAAGGDR